MTKHVTIAISGALFFAAFIARAEDKKPAAPAAAPRGSSGSTRRGRTGGRRAH